MNIKETLKKLEFNFELTKKYKAVIEDINDPDKDGKIRIRVAGVHPTSKIELPTEKLPWSKVIMESGSSGGMGKSINMLVGQWVEVIPATPSASSWNIIGNCPAVITKNDGDGTYGNVAEGEDNKIEDKLSPSLSTGDMVKIAGTAYTLANTALLKFTTGTGGADDGTPDLPEGFFDIVLEEVDWTLKEINKFGSNLGHFDDYIKIDDYPPKNTALIELIPSGANNSPGNIVGYDEDGEKIYVTYIDKNLYIPPHVLPGSYSIQYKVSEIAIPLNAQYQNILIEVIDEPLPKARKITPKATPRVQTTRPEIDVTIPAHNISEPPSTSDKAVYPYAKVDQGVENSVTIENDSTKGNRRYSITHMADKENSESISRFEMNPGGAMITKSADDMYIISKKNLLQYVENAVEQTIKGYLSINAPTILLKGNIRIEGHMNITGDITHKGNVTHDGHTIQDGSHTSTLEIHSDTEVSAKTIELTTHVHEQPNDLGGDGQQSTYAPTSTP